MKTLNQSLKTGKDFGKLRWRREYIAEETGQMKEQGKCKACFKNRECNFYLEGRECEQW